MAPVYSLNVRLHEWRHNNIKDYSKMKMTIVTFLGFLGVAVAAPIAQAQCCNKGLSESPECTRPQQGTTATEAPATPAEAHANPMMEGYSSLSTALFKGDLSAAKKAAAGIASHDAKSSLAPSARELSASTSIAAARQHFRDMSKVATRLVKSDKAWQVIHCPMAFDGTGANWVQRSGEQVSNPYMGSKMPRCGKRI